MTTTHTDHDCCANCGRLLNSYEEDWLCGPCTERARDDYYDPTDEELLRRDAITARFWLGDWAAIGLVVWVGIILTTLFVNWEMH